MSISFKNNSPNRDPPLLQKTQSLRIPPLLQKILKGLGPLALAVNVPINDVNY